jgi:hypothetical protein
MRLCLQVESAGLLLERSKGLALSGRQGNTSRRALRLSLVFLFWFF